MRLRPGWCNCAGVVVGPGVNEPDPFPGFVLSVAWAGVAHTRSAAPCWSPSNAGYWHVSPPTTYFMPVPKVEYYRSLSACRATLSPTGRIMFVRRRMTAGTWSKPQTLADTPAHDREAGLLALPSGTVLASFFPTSFGRS